MEWISVNEKLPEMKPYKGFTNYQESEICVVLIKSKTPEIALLNGNIEDEGDGIYKSWYCPQTDDIVENVTHWFLLPLRDGVV
jgi:hypothetical protein